MNTGLVKIYHVLVFLSEKGIFLKSVDTLGYTHRRTSNRGVSKKLLNGGDRFGDCSKSKPNTLPDILITFFIYHRRVN